MSDVARKAGVSITTVSHVLNETRPVAIRTRTRVLRAVDQLGYYKNTSARLLVRGQSELLGLIISDIENPFFPELIKSFEQASAAQGLQVLLCATSYQPAQAENAVRRMIENRVQGVAVMTSQFSPALQKQLLAKEIPLVTLGASECRRNHSSVAIDYANGVAQAVRHLRDLGHRKIAVLTGPQDQVSAVEYKEAVLCALRNSALKPFRVLEGDHKPESGAEAVRELLQGAERPTALLCGNDRMAIGALGVAVCMRCRVPADLSVIGADDVWVTRYSNPPLSTVRVPRDTLGQLAYDLLSKLGQARGKTGSCQVLPTQFVARESTGPAASQKK